MVYEPPALDEIDFALGEYDAPDLRSIDFALEDVTPVELSASGTGTGTGSADVTRVRSLTASGEGVGTGVATLLRSRSLSASGTGTGTGAAAIVRAVLLSAAGTGTGTGTADAIRERGLTAAGTGASEGSASVTRARSLSASGDGTGTGGATLTRSVLLAAAGGGTGTGAASVIRSRSLAASGNGTGTGVAAIVRERSFTASGSGVGFGSGILSLIRHVNKVSSVATVSTHTGTVSESASKVSAIASQLNAYSDFAIDNKSPSRGQDQQAISNFRYTPDGLSITIRTPITRIDELRQYNRNEGDFEQIIDSEGDWDIIDRSLTGSDIVITPPDVLTPTFVEDTYYIESYSESQASSMSRTVDATLRLIRENGRDPEDSSTVLTQTQASDDWHFEFSHGSIATELVQTDEQENQKDVNIEMILSLRQAEVIMESATRTDAVSVETVPDGDDFVRDNNQSDRNTVTINRPDNLTDDYLPTEGDYVVRDWSLESYKTLNYSVSMTVRKL